MEYLHAKVRIFLESNSMPPEYVDVVGRFLLVSRKGRAAELHARRGLTEIDTLYCDVLAALQFLLLQDGSIPSFPHGFCLLLAFPD